MSRIALGIEYNGSLFFGWERQKEVTTVQSVVESALSFVANQPIQVFCAGRTDAGVHALGQVIHFDTDVIRKDSAWLFGVNSNLPDDVAIQWVKQPVDSAFHARFSAVQRHYRYIICNQNFKPAFYRHHSAWYPKRLDEEKMSLASNDLLGKHDFTSFRSSGCQAKTPFRCIDHIHIFREKQFIIIEISANAFLHHMVRNIVGVLIAIGSGKKPVSWMKEVLDACDRTVAGVTAPASGLCLMAVDYPDVYQIP